VVGHVLLRDFFSITISFFQLYINIGKYYSGVSFLICLVAGVVYCLACYVVVGFPLFVLVQPPISMLFIYYYNVKAISKLIRCPCSIILSKAFPSIKKLDAPFGLLIISHKILMKFELNFPIFL
jgi:hypothetical protein